MQPAVIATDQSERRVSCDELRVPFLFLLRSDLCHLLSILVRLFVFVRYNFAIHRCQAPIRSRLSLSR
jgi:hypothetical protein